MIRCAIMVVMAMMVLQGCQTYPKSQATAPMVHKVLTVRVTQDQSFLYKGNRLSVEEFFAQADYAKGSKNVMLDVDQKSEIAESTIVKAIAFLRKRGYMVAMSDRSKYANLIP